MTEDIVTVLCGSCNTPLQGASDPDQSEQMSCLRCGQSDVFADVMNSVEAHAVEVATNSVLKGAEGIFDSNSIITVTVDKPSPKSYRWISDLKLDL